MNYTFKEKITLNSLLILFSLMNKLGINFFLDAGSLLKFIRNNKKITIGTDIDIGIFEKDKKKISNLKALLEKEDLMLSYKIIFQFIMIM